MFIKKYLKWISTALVLTGILLTNLNKPWDNEPSRSAFLIKSDRIDAVSLSHPLANKVFLAKSKISSN